MFGAEILIFGLEGGAGGAQLSESDIFAQKWEQSDHKNFDSSKFKPEAKDLMHPKS